MDAIRGNEFGPVVAGARLAKNEVVGAEQRPKLISANGIHRARLQIDEHGAWHVLVVARLVVVDGNAIELQAAVADIVARFVDAMLLTDHFPKLGANLVAALARLQVDNLTHSVRQSKSDSKMG